MKLLLDANLSYRIVPFLQEAFPGSKHVALIGLDNASDPEIFQAARESGFVIATNDSDYSDLSAVYGAPPHVIWLRTGNLEKAAALAILLKHRERIEFAFEDGVALAEIWS